MNPTLQSPDLVVPDAPDIAGLTFRRYAGEADIPALVEVLTAVEIADETFEIMSVDEMRNWLTNLNDFVPARDLLLAEVDGRVVAFAERTRTVRDGTRVYETFGRVAPDWRRRGLGRAMLRFNEARLRERSTSEEAAGATPPAFFGSYSLETAIGNRRLLEDAGYTIVRWFLELSRVGLDDVPAVSLPDGIEIRPVPVDRARDVLLADFEAFQDHWGARRMTETDIRRILGDPTTDISMWQVAWAGDEVVGSVQPAIFAADNAAAGVQRGWLDRVSVRRPWRRSGVGRALIAAALVELRRRGMEVASLGVDAENPTGALGLYEGLGFQMTKRSAAYRKAIDPG